METLILDRETYLGGSDAAAVLGLSPWTTPFMLYQKKIGAYREEITPAKQKILDRGKRWESIVVEMLVDELEDRGHDVKILARNQRYQDPEYPFLAAEIDLELLIDGEEVNGEAKTVNPFAAKQWGEPDSDDIPIYYAAQVMHGLMIKPRRRAVVAALTGFDDRPRVHWIDRDPETIASIRTREIEFWRRIENREPPEPTTANDVKWRYPRDYRPCVEANEEIAEVVRTLTLLKQDEKALAGNLEVLSTRVKQFMEDNTTLLFNGRPIATWKNNKDSRKTDWERAFYQLSDLDPERAKQAIQECTQTVPGPRVFKLEIGTQPWPHNH
jgi:putative phage-type endonuclease